MKCWRFDLRRKFSRYVSGELKASEVARLEDHLMGCGHCRAQLARIRDGHRLAQQMPRAALQRDPWKEIEAAINAERLTSPMDRIAWWRLRPVRYMLASALAVIAILMVTLIIMLNRLSYYPAESVDTAGSLDLGEFHAVRISDIEKNTRPHIVAEGYVSEVRIEKDGDLTFRLVEELHQPGPFIVCEIINPIRIDPPPVGSRVRVYGVSRYDGQHDRQWHEVHPVLNIEMVRH
ncbi:MAG TPA: zf-HC2 domain-containing protein [Blastocatellia bacterium]|nr:zf-HC2 domain-containing protein [Blastocatellia bacterium]